MIDFAVISKTIWWFNLSLLGVAVAAVIMVGVVTFLRELVKAHLEVMDD